MKWKLERQILYNVKNREIYTEKNELSLENLWNYNKIANILDWRVQEGEEQGVRAEKVLDERFQIWQEP